jgi:hypothetical protein
MELGVWCAEQVRKFGGVLEQPAHSKLWDAAGLPKPGPAGNAEEGFSISLPQIFLGHRAIKRSWFFIKGITPPQLPYPLSLTQNYPVPTGLVDQMGKRERNSTPLPMANWLLEVARRCAQNETRAA